MWIRLLPYILGIAGVLGIFGYVYMKGRSDKGTEVQVEQLKEIVEKEKKHEVKRQEVVRLPTSALRSRYCKWMRDSEQLCLQADIPIP